MLSVDISPVFRILMRTRLPWASLGPGSEAGGGAAPRPVRSEATSDLISAPVPGGDQTFPCTVSLSCPLSSDEGQAFQRVRCLPVPAVQPRPRANKELHRCLEFAPGPWCVDTEQPPSGVFIRDSR